MWQSPMLTSCSSLQALAPSKTSSCSDSSLQRNWSGTTVVADTEVMVGPSSATFHSGTIPSGWTVMGWDVHGATVPFTVMFTFTVSPPRGTVISVGSGCAIQETQVTVSWNGTHDSMSNLLSLTTTCIFLFSFSYIKALYSALYKHHGSIWSNQMKCSMLRVR